MLHLRTMDPFNLEYFNKKLRINQYGEIRIISDSMEPLILSGEIVKVVPITEKPNRFDIILFDFYGEPFCHFFWDIMSDDGKMRTRSLKSPCHSDIPFLEKNLIGKIIDKKITTYQKFKVYLKILCHKI